MSWLQFHTLETTISSELLLCLPSESNVGESEREYLWRKQRNMGRTEERETVFQQADTFYITVPAVRPR